MGPHREWVSVEGTAVMGAEPCASMSFPVEVYNCAMGSPDCSQCLGREDLGHLCVWSDSCRLRGPLQPLPGACPAPEIRAVSTPPPHGSPSCAPAQHTCLHTPCTRMRCYLLNTWVLGLCRAGDIAVNKTRCLPSRSACFR